MVIILNVLQPAAQARLSFNWCQYSAIHQSKQRSCLAQTLQPPTRPLGVIGTSWEACLYPSMTRVSPSTRCQQLRTKLSEFRYVFLVAGLAAYFFSQVRPAHIRSIAQTDNRNISNVIQKLLIATNVQLKCEMLTNICELLKKRCLYCCVDGSLASQLLTLETQLASGILRNFH